LTQIGLTGRKISQNLDYKTIHNGGCKIITLPIIKCSLSNEHESLRVEFGGYPTIINYNLDREKAFRKDKFNQKIRATNRSIKSKRLRQLGLTHNVIVSSQEKTGVIGGSQI